MSQQSCSACNELREYAPEFAENGVTANVENHLMVNEGLSGASGHTDCEDLHDANDCLIANMVDELDAFDVCEWKDFMGVFIPNIYETMKAMISSMCGQWCAVDALLEGTSIHVGEETDGDAYAVAGKGVSFLNAQGSEAFTTDINLTYIAGGLVRGGGSFKFYTSNFQDGKACANFDNDDTERISQSRKGNSRWSSFGIDSGKTQPIFGGELICEFRIKNSAFPEIKSWFSGHGQETGGGYYTVRAIVTTSGKYAYGQHGACNDETGEPHDDDADRGHLVPSGWTYIQLRLNRVTIFNGSSEGRQYSPLFFMGLRLDSKDISC